MRLERILTPRAMAKVRRLYNGIDLSAFCLPDRGHEVDRDTDHVLAVGRLVEKKGFAVLLDALGRLAPQRPALTATVVGDGEERPGLTAMASALGLADRIRFTGALDQDGVRALMRRATVFCLPCVVAADGNRDALPTVLLEALASGLPAISTPVSGVPEIVDHGRAGVLVPENDPGATALAISRLLDDAVGRHRLARNGRAHAAACFDLVTNSRVLGDWFDRLEAAALPTARSPEERSCASSS